MNGFAIFDPATGIPLLFGGKRGAKGIQAYQLWLRQAERSAQLDWPKNPAMQRLVSGDIPGGVRR